MRKLPNGENESEWVVKTLKEHGVNAILVDAKEQFYKARLDLQKSFKNYPNIDAGLLNELQRPEAALDNFKEWEQLTKPLEEVVHPEIKRKIIGEQFIRVFEKYARQAEAEWLIQGTLAPDWIESGGGIRDNIKSHHNVGGLPPNMNVKLFEPNRELYKDEVRQVAKNLNLPKELYARQPFPGPGLAIRVVGPANEANIAVVREANFIWEKTIEDAVEQEIIPIGIERQYLTGYFPEAKTVGVHGDIRCYGGAIALRCFTTTDYMAGEYEQLPHPILDKASRSITNKLKDHVNRVFYDCTNKPPGTTEFE